MNKDPLLSIIIPTKNGEKTIAACLNSIFFEQKGIETPEVIIIDSGSEDKTLDIVSQYPVRIVQIPPGDFGHGRTRNMGVELTKGKFILFTVQDARLANDDFLLRALAHFEDGQVKAVGAKQIVPHERDKNPLQWYRPVSGYKIQVLDPDRFATMNNEEKFFYARLDNVAAIYRREALVELSFPDVDFGEDILWAIEALARGWKIIIDHNLLVYHYHDYSSKDIKLRWLQERKLAERFGIKQKRFFLDKLKELVKITYLVFIKKGFVPERKFRWFLYNLRLWWWT